MHRIIRRFAWLLVINLIMLPVSSACGSDNGNVNAQPPVAILTVLAGSVTLVSQGAAPQEITGEEEAIVEVYEGDRVSTAAASEAVLTFFEGVEVWLAPATSLDVTTLEVEDAAVQVGMSMIVGQTISTVARTLDAGESFAIDTQAASISVRGTVFAVFVRENGLTQVASLEGEVEVATVVEGVIAVDEPSVTVPAGYGVRIEPGQPPGEVNVWGQAIVSATSLPDLEVERLLVVLTNVDNGQQYYYHTDEVMTALLGTYSAVVHSAGPYRVPEFTFPEDTEPEQPIEIGVALGALQVEVVDADGDAALLPERFLVTLQQDDLEGQIRARSGEPFAVGPGEWRITLALESEPDLTTTETVVVEAGALASVTWTAPDGD